MLYTLYSTPNVVLPFLGGFLVDRIGAQQMLLLLTNFVLIGQSIMAFGCTISSFRLMLVSPRRFSIPVLTPSSTVAVAF
jgi:hypothetical protein